MFEVDKTDSLEAEASIIGAALVRDLVVDELSGVLEPAHFRSSELGGLWAVMMATRSKGMPTRYGQMIAEGCDDSALRQCQDMVASHLGFETYAAQIMEAHKRRNVIAACMSTIDMARDSPMDGSFEGDVFDVMLGALGTAKTNSDVYSLKDSAQSAFTSALEALQNGGDVSGLSVGYPSIDSKTTGLQPGDLVILAARPGMGKTTLALNIARHACIEKQVAFFSLEMPHQQLGGKILSSEVGIGSQALRTGMIGGKQTDLLRAVERFGKWGLTIFDNSGATLGYMRSKLHQVEARTGKKTDLILLDYLQLMRGGRSENRVQEVSELSRGLKLLARDFKCPVIALSQLNRSVESRQDKRPLLSDLRESGSIEQDADMVWFIYREEYYDKHAPRDGAELIIAKQRNGPLCTVPLSFDGRLSRFKEPSFDDLTVKQANERIRSWQG